MKIDKTKIIIWFLKIFFKRSTKMFEKIRSVLSGKKTYIVMLMLILEGIVEYINDGDIAKLINKILMALGGITLRAGINKK